MNQVIFVTFAIFLFAAEISSLPAKTKADDNEGEVIGTWTFGNKKYTAINTSVNWIDAHRVCYELGMNLISIQSEVEQVSVEAVKELSNTQQVGTWTSGQHYDGLSVWTVDAYDNFHYTNWSEGSPSEGAANLCVSVAKSGFEYKWVNVDCFTEINVICETLKGL